MKQLILKLASFILLLALIVHYSCKDDKYADFEVSSTGLHYKITTQSESKVTFKSGDIVELKLKYSTINDSVLFNSDELDGPFRMQIGNSSHQGGSFEDALLILKPGARALFIIPADSFFIKTMHQNLPKQLQQGSNLIFDITAIRKLEQNEIELERKQLAEKMKQQEVDLLKQYLIDNKINTKPAESGLYYIELKKGSGKKAKNGDLLEVNYKGMLINQKVFDSSYDRNETFSFELGKGQVIQGWEEGFIQMQIGGKAKLIIPSNLAYANEGYGKIIPPYSSLIFEVELVDIQ